ncbi:PrpR N-terminal domain-containing protein [Clostridium sp. AM58-1XD]|uniref:PrpR N-terminal domain-containing protein n=1 Tax=Clostridium sp. AM58-1XD TaxID=2292307 RepID=UPI000E4AC948|nr:PrpR N-terminal domain-containing protein [Clostridium sp. AM58-1XD]RGY99869.1 hypothetical protein DXA13_06570 [Clostridium sp. AM58-1XD]
MGKIILIATTPAMREMGIELKRKLPDSDNLIVLQGAMDNAVTIAKDLNSKEADAIICRGASGRMLEEMDLSIPIIDISVSDEEVIHKI